MTLHVVTAGRLTLVQDRGRVGVAHLGVPRAGALDRPAADLANRLVGNDADDAVLEVLLGGLELRARDAVWVAVTGAVCPVLVDGRPVAHGEPVRWGAGSRLELGGPATGLRCYVAVSGGIAVEPVLGSRSTDTLAWVGPPSVVAGAVLPVGAPRSSPRALDTPRPPRPGPLRVRPGPRADWFSRDALVGTSYTVLPDSDRVGLRLDGPVLERLRPGELPSEGVVLGSVQVPPDGRPVVLLADHPPTGGYPVVAVVEAADLWQCAQLRPGDTVTFTAAPAAPAAARAARG